MAISIVPAVASAPPVLPGRGDDPPADDDFSALLALLAAAGALPEVAPTPAPLPATGGDEGSPATSSPPAGGGVQGQAPAPPVGGGSSELPPLDPATAGIEAEAMRPADPPGDGATPDPTSAPEAGEADAVRLATGEAAPHGSPDPAGSEVADVPAVIAELTSPRGEGRPAGTTAPQGGKAKETRPPESRASSGPVAPMAPVAAAAAETLGAPPEDPVAEVRPLPAAVSAAPLESGVAALLPPAVSTAREAEPGGRSLAPDPAPAVAPPSTALLGAAPPPAPPVPPVAPGTVGLPVVPVRVATVVADHIRQHGPGRHRLEITLHPPELGRVEVHLVVGTHSAHAHFVAQSEAGRDALAHHLPSLREQLAAQGFTDTQVGVDLAGHGGERQPRWQPPVPSSSSPPVEEERTPSLPHRPRASRRLLDRLV